MNGLLGHESWLTADQEENHSVNVHNVQRPTPWCTEISIYNYFCTLCSFKTIFPIFTAHFSNYEAKPM